MTLTVSGPPCNEHLSHFLVLHIPSLLKSEYLSFYLPLQVLLSHAAYIGGRLVTTPKGGDAMYFVVTFHILGHSVSIRIQKLKSKNRHPGRWRFLRADIAQNKLSTKRGQPPVAASPFHLLLYPIPAICQAPPFPEIWQTPPRGVYFATRTLHT